MIITYSYINADIIKNYKLCINNTERIKNNVIQKCIKGKWKNQNIFEGESKKEPKENSKEANSIEGII